VLMAGFFTLIGLARAGVILFWSMLPPDPQPCSAASSRRMTWATLGLLSLSLVLAAAASPLKRYTDAAAAQLADRAAYANAVLGPLGAPAADTTRPYRGGAGEVILPAPKNSP
jgi:multicomponent K+:H+ antiporter subunit D